MIKKVKELWIKALRSGKFKQGTGRLFDGDGYCCLGVLASVVDPSKKCWDDEDSAFLVADDSEFFSVTDAKQQRKSVGQPLSNDLIDALVNLNDIEEASFSEIADYIEENVPVDLV